MGPKEKQNKRRLSSGGIWQLDDQQPQQVLKTEVDEVKEGAAVICSIRAWSNSRCKWAYHHI
jgi:hypothetical protein